MQNNNHSHGTDIMQMTSLSKGASESGSDTTVLGKGKSNIYLEGAWGRFKKLAKKGGAK